MDITGNRLMASSIQSTIEKPQEQTVTFELMFPVDFANNIFDIRYLIFYEVTFYQIEEIIIPLGRESQMAMINDLGKITRKIKIPLDDFETDIIRQRFEIVTTVGKRTIDFSRYEFTENLNNITG